MIAISVKDHCAVRGIALLASLFNFLEKDGGNHPGMNSHKTK